ncbi:MAG: peptidoglycan DD-metalloendopeptidase family protein [Candidatus Roizmanbacteria bacterium]
MTYNHHPTAEIREFSAFLSDYIKDRVVHSGVRFEKAKDVIVAFLTVKRGKYSQSFLNTSFFILVSATLIAGPAIIENNPFIGDYTDDVNASSSSVLATDIYDLPFQTEFSQKPRATVEEYVVREGETLDSIAKKFDVDVDSIKWATNITTDKIKPGDKLKVPPVSGVVHTVKPGESIYTIAKRYNTSSQAIVNYPFNDFEDLDTFALTPGQTLIVPDGVPPKVKPPVRRIPIGNIAAGQPGSGQFIWPTTGSITQYPVWYHMALDIANRSLPPIIAADTGTVSYAGCISTGYGCHVIIDHGNGFQTLYGHMSRIDVSAGQGVSKGQGIGRLGSTGRSTGPHLHFEVRKGGALLNPLGFLQ